MCSNPLPITPRSYTRVEWRIDDDDESKYNVGPSKKMTPDNVEA
jgi:hypothetical protein